MNHIKLLLLAGSATLVAGASARAADLPSGVAAPVSYVRVCDVYGSGFFYIPGTDTCLRAGGYVRAEYSYTPSRTINSVVSANPGAVSQIGGAQDTTGMEVRGRIDLDARTQTQWGTVQTAVWLRATNTDGMKALNGTTATATAVAAAAYAPGGNAATSIVIERAYIRFAGITAGVAEENFSAIPITTWVNYPFPNFYNGIKQLAYTATFGAGFSATLAVESSGDIYNSNGVAQYDYRNSWSTGYTLVGNARYDSAWGFAQIQGALANDSARTDLTTTPNGVTLSGPTYSPTSAASTYGAFAIGATIDVKLPMIAPGDVFAAQFAYGHGLLGLVGCSSTSDCGDAAERRMVGGVLRQDQNLVPVFANGTPGAGHISYGVTDAWALYGTLTHYWTSQWRTNVMGGYERITPPRADGSVGVQLGDASLYMAGAALIWSPTKSFDIGIEVDYLHLTSRLQNAVTPNVSAAWLAAGSPGLSGDNWTGRVRLQRQF